MSKADRRARKKANRAAKLAPLYDAHLDFAPPTMVNCVGCRTNPQVVGVLTLCPEAFVVGMFTLACQVCGSDVCEYAP